MRRGWIDEQLVRSRALYRAQVRAAARGARAHDAGGRRSGRARSGGFFSWLTLPGGDAAELARARRRGGRRRSSPARSSTRTAAAATNVRLSFSMVDEALIDDGIERLAALV